MSHYFTHGSFHLDDIANHNMGFDYWARENGLTDKTINILKKEDINQKDLLSLMKEDEVENLNLTIGQKVLLKEVIRRLKLINIEPVANSVSASSKSSCEQSFSSGSETFCDDCKYRLRRISTETCSSIGLSQVSCDLDDVVSTVSYYDLPSDSTISNMKQTREVVLSGVTGETTSVESELDMKKTCITCLYPMSCKSKPTPGSSSNSNGENASYMLKKDSDRQSSSKKWSQKTEPVIFKRSQVYVNCNYYCENVPIVYDDKVSANIETGSESEGYKMRNSLSLPPELVARTVLEVLLQDFSRILEQSK